MPSEPAAQPVATAKTHEVWYKVTGTQAQLDILENFMNTNSIAFEQADF
jgi:hypothetical protein